jgi:hypothetical protein
MSRLYRSEARVRPSPTADSDPAGQLKVSGGQQTTRHGDIRQRSRKTAVMACFRWSDESRPENVVTVDEVKPPRHKAEQRAPTDAQTIFISYPPKDAYAARRLDRAISDLDLGGHVWLDERERFLRAGGPDDDAWERETLTAIRTVVGLFLPIISAKTKREDEGYDFREWMAAVDRRERGIMGRRFIVPVVVDEDYADDPSRYRRVPPDFMRFDFGHAPAGEPDARLLEMLKREIREMRRPGIS